MCLTEERWAEIEIARDAYYWTHELARELFDYVKELRAENKRIESALRETLAHLLTAQAAYRAMKPKPRKDQAIPPWKGEAGGTAIF